MVGLWEPPRTPHALDRLDEPDTVVPLAKQCSAAPQTYPIGNRKT